jgi:hypothetical protein
MITSTSVERIISQGLVYFYFMDWKKERFVFAFGYYNFVQNELSTFVPVIRFLSPNITRESWLSSLQVSNMLSVLLIFSDSSAANGVQDVSYCGLCCIWRALCLSPAIASCSQIRGVHVRQTLSLPPDWRDFNVSHALLQSKPPAKQIL